MAERSLREELEAAARGDGEPDAPVEVVAAAPQEAQDGGEAAAAPDEAAKASEAASGGQERGPDGKFLPKNTPQGQASAEAPPAKTESETAKPEEQEAPKEPIRVPPSLPAAVKAKFETLDPDVRDAFVKLEETVQTAKAEWGKKGERLNRYEEILGPHVDKWRINGLDEFSGIQTLIAAQNSLERNPLDGLVHIARSYGVTAQQLAQHLGFAPTAGQTPGAGGQHAPTQTPDLTGVVKPLTDRLQTLEERIQSSQRAAEAAELARITAEVEAFKSDPANLYYANVEEDMAKLISSGQATSLKDAYEKAIWSSPEIRPLLLKAQAVQAQPPADAAKKAAEEAQRRKAADASKASGSVTGAPAPGAQAPKGPPGSVRDSIMAAKQELGAL